MNRIPSGVLSCLPSRYLHDLVIPTKKFKRRRYSFDQNKSISRRIYQGHQEEIDDAIADHAFRRIQIFYFQSLVYYQTRCDILLGRTEVQYGTSNYPWSQAAHSSLLTHLLDNYFQKVQMGIIERRIDIKETDYKLGLIHPKSALYAAMNSTVELPKEVNQFDCILERNLRKKALEILNQVANDSLHPCSATQKLVEEIGSFFQKSIDETEKKIELMKKMESVAERIRSFELNIQEGDLKIYLESIRQIDMDNKTLKILKGHSIHKNNGFSLEWRRGLLTMKKQTHRRILNRVKKKVTVTKELPAVYGVDYMKRLENSLEIIRLQWNNTRLPPFANDSKTVKELLEEQVEIIRKD